jgi:hypothetical protein
MNMPKVTLLLTGFIVFSALSPRAAHASFWHRSRPEPAATASPVPAPSSLAPTAERAGLPDGFEEPRPYSQSDLIERGRTRAFSSRIEFEHLVQAKYTAKTTWLNLIPHLSINSIIGLGSISMASLLGSVGDLVPFLLPTRWFMARGATARDQAEAQALVAMKLDTMAFIQSLTLGIGRDTEVVQQLEQNLGQIRAIRDEIHDREKLGQFPLGSSDDISALVNALDQDLSALHGALAAEYTTVAQIAGFQNPKAIESIRYDLPPGMTGVRAAPDEQRIIVEALNLSPELRQMDFLIDASRWDSKTRTFQWLDPAGDAQGGLGVALGSYLAVGRSQVSEMRIRREQLRSALSQKVVDTLNDLQIQANSYRLAGEGVEINFKRVQRLTDQMSFGTGFDLMGLALALQDWVKDGVGQSTARYNAMAAQCRLDRILRQGPYARAE